LVWAVLVVLVFLDLFVNNFISLSSLDFILRFLFLIFWIIEYFGDFFFCAWFSVFYFFFYKIVNFADYKSLNDREFNLKVELPLIFLINFGFCCYIIIAELFTLKWIFGFLIFLDTH
jgi:hypothetical protein